MHLGHNATADEALTAWQREKGELQTTRPKQAQKLRAKLVRLKVLMDCETYTTGIGEVHHRSSAPDAARIN